jgi:hypothetical protein
MGSDDGSMRPAGEHSEIIDTKDEDSDIQVSI